MPDLMKAAKLKNFHFTVNTKPYINACSFVFT